RADRARILQFVYAADIPTRQALRPAHKTRVCAESLVAYRLAKPPLLLNRAEQGYTLPEQVAPDALMTQRQHRAQVSVRQQRSPPLRPSPAPNHADAQKQE